MKAVLVVICGLPGTGKTAIARPLASKLHAAYVRIDTIEQAIADSGEAARVIQSGYLVGQAVAADQLRLGLDVVAECVNPFPITREAWRTVAARAGAKAIEVELVCSDSAEHRRRVESRQSDVPGLVLPTWPQARDRDYAPWPEPHIVIDTAALSPMQAVERIMRTPSARGASPARGPASASTADADARLSRSDVRGRSVDGLL